MGGISHETNTFSPMKTTLDAFRARAYLVGDAVVQQGRGARNVLGGIVDAATEAGATLVPTLFASATPGGVVTREAFEHLRDRLLDRLRPPYTGPLPLSGVVLALHGAMVAEGEENAEGALLRDVRAVIGPNVPLVAVLDFHANVSSLMATSADLLIGYGTYPHVDTYERGQEAVEHVLTLRRRPRHPATALRIVPLLAPLPAQRTTGPTPMRDVMRHAEAFRREPGVVSISVAGGFPYSDVPAAGLSVHVATDGDQSLADSLADRVASTVWDRRARFATRGLPPDEAIDRALDLTKPGRPVVLADVADNPGAGAAGDGTTLLARLLARGVTGAALGVIADPETVAAAAGAGVGGVVRRGVGGRTDSRTGAPVEAAWRVCALTDGAFTNRGPMGTGGATRLGRTAVLEAGGVEVVVCERRVQALDPELFRAAGIDPAARRVLAVKSSVHFRAAFEPLAAAVLEVETPGLSGSDLVSLPYRRVRRPIWPLDREVRFLA
ncbi:MAG: M81 family metallopeptidase [Chloroflexota bacterium]|nr:M81 family metallopeptidase [Chloroflexota bacterium]